MNDQIFDEGFRVTEKGRAFFAYVQDVKGEDLTPDEIRDLPDLGILLDTFNEDVANPIIEWTIKAVAQDFMDEALGNLGLKPGEAELADMPNLALELGRLHMALWVELQEGADNE